MTAEQHIIAWIESSRPHYDRLIKLWVDRPHMTHVLVVQLALNLVLSAYREMLSCGDASRDDMYSPVELARTAAALCEWELEQ